jgi:c(7)-type cytochrome triheme protein
MWCATRWVAKPVLVFSSFFLVVVPPIAAALTPAGHDSSPAAAAIEIKLPADIVYSRVPGSDSAVVFRHESHAAFVDNHCTACHPQTFPMLRRGPAPSHTAMNERRSCGTCHNGKDAFDVQDTANCSTCHAGVQAAPATDASAAAGGSTAPATRQGPGPHTYPAGESSPGKVTFRHATHMRGAAGCNACHPKLFKMAAAPPLPAGGMHEAAACGACHDGSKAFAAMDDASCMRCHAETGAKP